jgi:hypothetical protein
LAFRKMPPLFCIQILHTGCGTAMSCDFY